jgi:myo-inositol 2-dehydrogenase/D-chiro-inositol 1-dehydrogenase
MSGPGAGPPPLRIGLVGAGEVCEHKHLPALRRVRSAQVVAIADPDADRTARLASRFAIPYRFSGVEQLLAADVVDVVGVLTPPATHAGIALAALATGRHVLIEKPLVLTLGEADRLVEATRSARGRVVMGLHMRWHRLVRRAREAIADGIVGTPESIRSVWSSPRGDAGIPDWKRSRTTGGGAIVELAVHLFDLWRFLTGAEVEWVSAEVMHGARDDERAIITGGLTNGMLASAVASERTTHDLEIQVAGDRGRLRLACQRFDGWEWYGAGETDGMVRPRLRGLARALADLPIGLSLMGRLGDYGDSYRAEWQHVVDVACGGAAPACTVEDGRAALRIVLAAAAAASHGHRVRIADAPDSVPGVARG